MEGKTVSEKDSIPRQDSTKQTDKWFLFIKDHHKGPFSYTEVVELYKNGVIDKENLLWLEGSPEWKKLKTWEDFSTVLNLSLNSSALPQKPRAKKIKRKVQKTKKTQQEELPPIPPADIDEENEKKSIGKNLRNWTENLGHREVFQNWDREKFLRLLSFLTTFFFILGVVNIVSTGATQKEKFVGLSSQDYQKLQTFHSMNVGSFEQMENLLAPSRRGHSIWLASNFHDRPFRLVMSLRSIDPYTLGQSSVVITSETVMKNGLAQFREWTLSQGQAFAPGFYEYEILGHQWKPSMSDSNTIDDSLIHRFEFNSTEFEVPKPNPAEFQVRGQIVFGRFSADELASHLTRDAMREQSELIEVMDLWEQGLQTFTQMLNRMEVLAIDVLSEIQTGEEFSLFEQRYANEVAGVLQGIVVDFTQTYGEVRETYSEILSHLDHSQLPEKASTLDEDMARIGRDVMGLSVRWSELVSSHLTIDRTSRERLSSLIREESRDYLRELNQLTNDLNVVRNQWEASHSIVANDFTTTSETHILDEFSFSMP